MSQEQYGLSSAGFRLKRLRQILDEMQQKMSTVKDPDSGETLQVDWNENDPFIQFMQIACDELSALWELVNGAYEQFDPQKATGQLLSSLVQLNGIRRKQGEPSTVLMKFMGTPGVYIPQGTRVADADKTYLWATSAEATVPSVGYVQIICNSVENGAFSVAAGTINEMIDDVSNIDSCVNESSSVPGVANESDIELRRRRAKSTESPSVGLAESIYGSIASIEGVLYCKVFTNRTMETDEHGIPPKSVSIVVQVQDKTDEDLKLVIGKQIFLHSGLGEEFYAPGVPGDDEYQEVKITDRFQQVTDVRFVYPKEVPIWISMTISKLEQAIVPEDYEEQIRNNILNFAANGVDGLGVQIDSATAFDTYGFPPSEDVVVSRLYTAINAVKGIKVDSLQIKTTGGVYGTADIPIDWDEIANFVASRIIIEHTWDDDDDE